MRKKNKLVQGVGINDADYSICHVVKGRQVTCPIYTAWSSMLRRCYSNAAKSLNQTYIGCYVCEEWLTFSNFSRWMLSQDWRGMSLDKDILYAGNKVYSPDKCVFVSAAVNTFIIDSAASRGDFPVGCHFDNKIKRFKSQCQNPFTKKKEHLGLFDCPNQAHQMWRKRKHELACQLAELQTDDRVAEALRLRYD